MGLDSILPWAWTASRGCPDPRRVLGHCCRHRSKVTRFLEGIFIYCGYNASVLCKKEREKTFLETTGSDGSTETLINVPIITGSEEKPLQPRCVWGTPHTRDQTLTFQTLPLPHPGLLRPQPLPFPPTQDPGDGPIGTCNAQTRRSCRRQFLRSAGRSARAQLRLLEGAFGTKRTSRK